jgi:hypothetical protein
MMDELEDLHMIRLRALENIEKNKLRVAKYYNKKVKVRQFAEGNLVWKALLPIGTKYSEFGKWSPNWEGPFWVVRCVPGNAYMLKPSKPYGTRVLSRPPIPPPLTIAIPG